MCVILDIRYFLIDKQKKMVKIMNTKKYIFCRKLTNEFIVTIQTNTECLKIVHHKTAQRISDKCSNRVLHR